MTLEAGAGAAEDAGAAGAKTTIEVRPLSARPLTTRRLNENYWSRILRGGSMSLSVRALGTEVCAGGR